MSVVRWDAAPHPGEVTRKGCVPFLTPALERRAGWRSKAIECLTWELKRTNLLGSR